MKNAIRLIILLLTTICVNNAYAQLNANFTASTTSGCAPLVVNFSSTSSGSPTSYSWNIGGTPSTLQNPSRTFTSPGTYTVTLTVYNGSSSDVETKTNYITVHPKPSVNFSASPLSGCSPLSVNFTDASTPGGTGANTYSWFMGSSVGFKTGPNPSAVFTSGGSQSITLTVTNSFGCTESHTKTNYINVVPKPSANFTASPVDFCSSPLTTTFTGNATGSGPFTYTWIYGDGSPNGTGTSSSHTYTAPPNTWSPRLVATDVNGCKDTFTRNNYINIHYPTAGISSANSVCQGAPISFSCVLSPATGGTVAWNFGDGLGLSTSTNPTYTYATSGSFTVTLTYTFKGCTATATKTVTVNPKPAADFIIDPDSLCPAPATTQFKPVGTFSSYLWDFGVTPPATSTAASPTYTYLQNGVYSPRLIVTSAAGCRDTITKTGYVPVYDLLVGVDRNPTKGCVPLTVNFYSSVLREISPIPLPYPYGVKSYSWNFGDGKPLSTLANPIHTYTDTGVFNVTLTVTTNNGCTKSATTQVKVGAKPTANFTISPTQLCYNDFISLLDASTGNADEWKWIIYNTSKTVVFGANTKDVTTFIKSLLGSRPGVFSVMHIASYYGCEDTIIKPNILTIDSPMAAFNEKISCDTPNKVNLEYKAIGATSHIWLFGDPSGSTSNAINPSFTYPTTGTYTIRLATYNSRSGCTDTMQKQVTLTNRNMTLTANDTTVCPGDSVRFNSLLTGRQPNSYKWYVNNVYVSDSSINYTRRFTTPAFHKVKVVIIDNMQCIDSLVRNNYIFVSKPVAALSGTPTVGCTPMLVNFTNNSTITPGPGATIADRVWNFGVGANVSVSGNTTSFTYTTRGLYDVKLMVRDMNGCTDTLTQTAYINAKKPIADFSVKDTACINEVLAFTNASSSAQTAQWDFGDGSTSTNMSPNYSYKAKGSYTVRLIVTDDFGCKDTSTKVAAVSIVKPDPSFTLSDSVAVCPPLLVRFNNTTPNARTYIWKTGLSTSTTFNTSEFYTANGKYDVTLIVTDKFGCTDSTTQNVKILGYQGAFTYTPLIGCKPLDVTFNATTTNVASLTWDFDDGVVVKSLSGTITHRYETPGGYLPRIIFEDATGCKASSDGKDSIKVDAVEANFIPDAPCKFSTVTLRDSSKTYFTNATLWRWTFHDNTTSFLQYPQKYYGAPGSFPIKLFVKNTLGCEDSITKNITIHDWPTINAGADTTICLQDTAQLYATGGIKYKWNTTPLLSCLDCPDPLAFPKEAFQFIVQGTDINGCTNKDSLWVRIKTKVTAIAGPDKEICDKDAVSLDVKGARTYLWTPPTGLDNATSANPVASPSQTTKYMVVSFEGRCIPDTDFVNVKVYPLPDVKATGEKTIIAGSSTPILATGNKIDKFRWEPAATLSCADCPDPSASPSKTTTYTIKVFTDFGCVDSDKVTITVLCDEGQLFIPNTFTPNGDGQNDVFYPRGNGLDRIKSFRIYNRWGETVFERNNFAINDPQYGWDGNFKGTTLPPDAFVYIVEAYCDNGQIMIIKGDITLIR